MVEIGTAAGRQLLIVIEAKYKSPKSNTIDLETDEEIDQLACQWQHAVARAMRESLEPFLIYITAHAKMPTREIQESIDRCRLRTPTHEPAILWLAWQQLAVNFASSLMPVQQDLAALGRRIDPLRPGQTDGRVKIGEDAGTLAEVFGEREPLAKCIANRSQFVDRVPRGNNYANLRLNGVTYAMLFPADDGIDLVVLWAAGDPDFTSPRLLVETDIVDLFP